MSPASDPRPLGVWELVRDFIADRPTRDHWYWCRKHEKAEHASAPTNADPSRRESWCIRIGPFMSEAEANRLRDYAATRSVARVFT